MGFQFNHVGGGTKTRRPITLHMKYNAACVQPNCYLVTEDCGDQPVTLEELQVPALRLASHGMISAQSAGLSRMHALTRLLMLQEHIESENQRLEREQQFWAKEIVVKIEYKCAPSPAPWRVPSLAGSDGGLGAGTVQACRSWTCQVLLPGCLWHDVLVSSRARMWELARQAWHESLVDCGMHLKLCASAAQPAAASTGAGLSAAAQPAQALSGHWPNTGALVADKPSVQG